MTRWTLTRRTRPCAGVPPTRLALSTLEDRVVPAYILTPEDIRFVYSWDFKYNSPPLSLTNTPSPANGAGQTIAIIDAYHDRNIVSDLRTFERKYNLPATQLFIIGQDLCHPSKLAPPEPGIARAKGDL